MTKIAIVTDDGQTISAHFGRAAYYMVITVENGQVTGRERREKPAHEHGHGGRQGGMVTLQDSGAAQGDAPEGDHHGPMIEAIRDCQVAVGRGMGQPMYERLTAAGIQPVLTDVREIDEAVRQYVAGELTDHPERLH